MLLIAGILGFSNPRIRNIINLFESTCFFFHVTEMSGKQQNANNVFTKTKNTLLGLEVDREMKRQLTLPLHVVCNVGRFVFCNTTTVL